MSEDLGPTARLDGKAVESATQCRHGKPPPHLMAGTAPRHASVLECISEWAWSCQAPSVTLNTQKWNSHLSGPTSWLSAFCPRWAFPFRRSAVQRRQNGCQPGFHLININGTVADVWVLQIKTVCLTLRTAARVTMTIRQLGEDVDGGSKQRPRCFWFGCCMETVRRQKKKSFFSCFHEWKTLHINTTFSFQKVIFTGDLKRDVPKYISFNDLNYWIAKSHYGRPHLCWWGKK